ncbi:unnamed protein product [Cylicostephanus goldi]|uniref:Uncharacterized protein n=1 Tax=Cylicostephanus goldi TaxID=71465 RepID=A0A3P7ML14_CYLGO|nr:unnamed protein product [Cylicostephanus goldi]
MRTGNCSGFTDDDPCYASKCVRGVCVPLMAPILKAKEHTRRKIAERAAPLIDAITKETITSTPDPVEALLELVNEEQLSDDYNLTMAYNSTYTYKSVIPQGPNNPAGSNGSEPEELPPSTQTSPTTTNFTSKATTTKISFTNPLFDNPHFDRRLRTWVYGFDDFLPYPSAYFPVTVLASNYRPRFPPSRSLGDVMVFSQGENLPNGYTHIVEHVLLHAARGPVVRQGSGWAK